MLKPLESKGFLERINTAVGTASKKHYAGKGKGIISGKIKYGKTAKPVNGRYFTGGN